MWRVSGAGEGDLNGIYLIRSREHIEFHSDSGKKLRLEPAYNFSCKGMIDVYWGYRGERKGSGGFRSVALGREIYFYAGSSLTAPDVFLPVPKVEHVPFTERRFDPEEGVEYTAESFVERWRDEVSDDELWRYWQSMDEPPKDWAQESEALSRWKSDVTSTNYSTVVAALKGISESSSACKKLAEGLDPEAVMECEFARVKEAEAEGTLQGPSDETINPDTCAEKGGMPWEDVLLLMLRQIENKDPNSVIYFFIPREDLLATEGALPCFQILAKQGKLRGFKMDVAAAVRHKYRKRFAIISHRWTARGDPDPTGAQLTKIKEMARANPSVEYFWIDFPCIPQSWKDNSGSIHCEKCDINSQYFKQGLKNVNVLYLGGEVWILLDVDYIHRFWCILEAFLATHDTTKHGLIKSLDHVKIGCMGVAESYPDAFETVLKCIVYEVKDTSAMLENLKRDDAFTVTNQSDKDTQVEVLSHLEDKIKMLCREP